MSTHLLSGHILAQTNANTLNPNKVSGMLRIIQAATMRGLGALSAIVFTLVVSRHLPSIDARDWFVVFNLVTVLGTCLRWGIDEVLVKILARKSNQGDLRDALIGTTQFLKIRLVYGIAVVGSLALLVAYPLSSRYGVEPIDIALTLIAAIVSALVMSIGRMHQGLGRPNMAAFVLTIGTPLLTTLLLILLIFKGVDLAWKETLILFIFSSFAVLTLASSALPIRIAYLLRIFFCRSAHWNSRSKITSSFHSSANTLGFVVLGTQSLPWAGALIIPYLFPPDAANAFVVSLKLANSIGLISLVINFALARNVARVFHSNDMISATIMLKRGLTFVGLASAVAVSAGLMFNAEIATFSNIATPESSFVLAYLLISQAFFGITTFLALFLTMSGNESALLRITASANVAGILALVISGSQFEIRYAALTYAVTYAIYAFVVALRVRSLIAMRSNGGSS